MQNSKLNLNKSISETAQNRTPVPMKVFIQNGLPQSIDLCLLRTTFVH